MVTKTKAAPEKPPRVKRATKPAPAPAPVPPSPAEQLSLIFDDLLIAYAGGVSLEQALLDKKCKVAPYTARAAIYANPELKKRWLAVREHRARHQIELAGDLAIKLGKNGFANDAAKLLITLAGKTNPKEFGDKSTIEHTGADGGEIKSTVTLTPGDAYRKMLGKL